MKNILLLISLFITCKAFGQAIPPPVNPQPVPQMSWSREPSTNKMFANRGPVLGYWQPTDSLQVVRMIGGISPTLTFSNGLTRTANNIKLGGSLTDETIIGGTGQLGIYSGTPGSGVITAMSIYNSTVGLSWLNQLTGTSRKSYGVLIADFALSLFAQREDDANSIIMNINLTDGMTIKDNIHSRGAEYVGDYETNFVARSLVTKQYVDGLISGGLITASNGLTKTVNNIKLGGTLVDTTTLINTNGNSLLIGNSSSGASPSMVLTPTSSGFGYSPDGVITNQISIDNFGHKVIDNSFSRGFVNGGDYEANFVNRSLVTKQYVTSAISTATTTASNGITKTGNNFTWGDSNPLTTPVSITGTGANGITQTLYDDISAPTKIVQMSLTNSGGVQGGFGGLDLITGDSFAISASTVSALIRSQKTSLQFLTAGNIITDTHASPKGIEYAANYDGTLGANSLVPKRMLDSVAKAKADSVAAAHPGTGGTVTSITPGYGFTSSTPITTSGTLVVDTTKILTVLNTFPKNDTRYYTKTLADGRYQPLEDQRLSTTNSPSFIKQSIIGTAGGGYEDFISQSVSPVSSTGHLRIYSDSLNRLSWKNSLYRRTIQVPYPTDFTIRMPYRATQTTLVDSTDAKVLYTYTAGIGINIASNVVKSDTTVNQTVVNFFPKADTRYYTKTAADAKYAVISGGNSFTGTSTFGGPVFITPFSTAGVVTINGSAQLVNSPSLSVILGGTGQTTLTANSLLVGNGTTAITQLGNTLTNAILVNPTSGGAPAYSATPSIGGLLTLQNGLTVSSGNISMSGGGQLIGPGVTGTTTNSTVNIQMRPFTSAGQAVQLANSAVSNSTGPFIGVSITPTYTQTGTAVATDLTINRTEISIGSGNQRILDLQRNNVSMFNVDRLGHAMIEGVTSTGATGTGQLVFGTSPTFTTPSLGTPASGVLTNTTGLPTAGLVNNAVTYAKMQAVTTNKLLGSGSGTAVSEITLGTALSFTGSTLNVATINRSHTIFTPTTGGTVVLINNQFNIINPAGTLIALTVTLPSSPANNDIVNIKYTQAVTTVTYNGGTVVDGITSPVAGGLVILTYDSGSNSWY